MVEAMLKDNFCPPDHFSKQYSLCENLQTSET